MSGNAIGIVGTDGYTPMYQPDGRWAVWSIHEIYLGEQGENKVIPKVGDYIIEPETGNLFIVVELDQITYIAAYAPITLSNDINTSTDILITETSDNYRVYYDKSVLPYTLAVDAMIKIYSSASNYARLYKGTIIDDTKIISRLYDNSGNYIGSDIPLQLVAFNTHDNYAIKSIPICNTNNELQNGEIITIVTFDSSGKVVSKRTTILEETTFISQAFSEQKYIVNISLKSPFITNSVPDVINYPVNLPLESLNLIGTVSYNDGTSVDYPVDGSKFNIYGLDQFTSTIIGHKVPLVLSYRLDSTESALSSVTSDDHFVTRPYMLQVSNPNTSYNVKLYIYPIWVDEVNGYNYRAYLMNLDRNIFFDVTDKVSLTSNSPSFNPLLYGVTQRLTFMLELSRVSGIFNFFIHTQTVDIVLRSAATDIASTNFWEVSNQVPTSVPYYGSSLKAIRNNAVQTKINLSNNHTTVEDWLNVTYKRTNPVINPLTELEPITPSHMEIRYLNNSVIVPVEDFISEITMPFTLSLLGNIDIIFLKEIYNGYLKLSVASMIIK